MLMLDFDHILEDQWSFRLLLLGCEEDNADDKTSGDNERVRLSGKKRLDVVLG